MEMEVVCILMLMYSNCQLFFRCCCFIWQQRVELVGQSRIDASSDSHWFCCVSTQSARV